MTIVLILIAVSVTSYQQIQLKARETVLKQNLVAMRKAIDEYAADREKLPGSLDDLVSANYINEVPIDPIPERPIGKLRRERIRSLATAGQA